MQSGGRQSRDAAMRDRRLKSRSQGQQAKKERNNRFHNNSLNQQIWKLHSINTLYAVVLLSTKNGIASHSLLWLTAEEEEGRKPAS